MLNCKNCGAPLTLDDAYCPHCGTANPEAQKHLEKLKELDRKYDQTRQEVVNEVRSSRKGYNTLIILVLLLLANLLVMLMHGASYEIAEKVAVSRMAKADIETTLKELVAEGRYSELSVFVDKYDLSYQEYGEYLRLSYLASDYSRCRKYVSDYFHEVETYADPLFYACNSIKDFKDEYQRDLKQSDEPYLLENAEKMNAEFDRFLERELKLSADDIAAIDELSSSELLVLITRRLNNEEE